MSGWLYQPFAPQAVASGALTGTCSFAFSNTGALTGTGALAGSSALSFTAAGTLSELSGAMSGTAAMTFGASGTFVPVPTEPVIGGGGDRGIDFLHGLRQAPEDEEELERLPELTAVLIGLRTQQARQTARLVFEEQAFRLETEQRQLGVLLAINAVAVQTKADPVGVSFDVYRLRAMSESGKNEVKILVEVE